MGVIYLIRHGETEWNSQGRIQGHTDIGLSEIGHSQAVSTAKRLENIKFDAAYSSDLTRTKDTAKVILGNSSTPLQATETLREYNKGVFEGLTFEEYSQKYPDLYKASLVNDLDFSPTDGESARQVSDRMATFSDEIKSKHDSDTVLVVGHGGALRCLVSNLLSLPPEFIFKLVTDNCSITVIHTYPDNTVLHLYNDSSHIKKVN